MTNRDYQLWFVIVVIVLHSAHSIWWGYAVGNSMIESQAIADKHTADAISTFGVTLNQNQGYIQDIQSDLDVLCRSIDVTCANSNLEEFAYE